LEVGATIAVVVVTEEDINIFYPIKKGINVN
jgi:hypothetical protein